MEDICSFALELPAEDMIPERIEDVVYNCLDFCQLYGRTPHFCLLSENAEHVWAVLELLHEENADFSLLTEPERSEYKMDASTVRIDKSGNAQLGNAAIGNLLEDRLADLWVTAGSEQSEDIA